MEHLDQIILDIVKEILGDSKTNTVSALKPWWSFNCITPTCIGDHNKFNLAYNSTDKRFKCWKCEYKASIYDFLEKYGDKEKLDKLKLLVPKGLQQNNFIILEKDKKYYESLLCELPKEYMPLSVERNTDLYKLAWNYIVNDRKITLEQIDKFKIGYTEVGDYKHRIILPSIGAHGKINYFEARSYIKTRESTYKKPESPGSSEIIFDEFYINWDIPVFLCEGRFDSIRLPNAVPMLGKIPSPVLIRKLIDNKCTVIVCIDSDAMWKGVEIYKMFRSLGLMVYFVDLTGYKDPSAIFEKLGNKKLIEIISNIKKIDEVFEFDKMLKL